MDKIDNIRASRLDTSIVLVAKELPDTIANDFTPLSINH